MDMMFSRYANPMPLLGQMVKGQRLTEFVNEFIKIRNEELEGQTQWEFWLHKVFDMTYQEFLSKIDRTSGSTTREEAPSKNELETIVKESWGTLNSFCPE
jgi:hypothetical protein